MRVQVLYFQSVRRVAGVEREVVELPDRATIQDLLDGLGQRRPELAALAPTLLFARNEEHVGAEAALAEGDIVALMPPFSGG